MRSVNKYPLTRATSSFNFSRLLKPTTQKRYTKKTWSRKGTRGAKSKILRTPESKSKQHENLEKYFSRIRASKRETKVKEANSKKGLNSFYQSFQNDRKVIPFLQSVEQIEMPNSKKIATSLDQACKIYSYNIDKSRLRLENSSAIDMVIEGLLAGFEQKDLEWRALNIGNELIAISNAKFSKEIEKPKRDVEIQTSMHGDSIYDDQHKLHVRKTSDKHVGKMHGQKQHQQEQQQLKQQPQQFDFIQKITNKSEQCRLNKSTIDGLFQTIGQDNDNFMANFASRPNPNYDLFSFDRLSIEQRTRTLDWAQPNLDGLKFSKLEDLY